MRLLLKTLGPSVPHLRAEEEVDNTARRFDASLPGSRVILGPDTHVLIQVVGAQDGGISREVLEVVHYDSNKEIQHLGAKGANRSREETIGVGERDKEIPGEEEQTRWGRVQTQTADTEDTHSEANESGSQRQRGERRADIHRSKARERRTVGGRGCCVSPGQS